MWKVEVRKSNIVKLPQGTKTSPNELFEKINRVVKSEYLDDKNTGKRLTDTAMLEKAKKDT